jgi:hypothetical protein
MNLIAFLIFHLKVGARLASKKLAPVLGALFVVYYIFKPEFFNELFAALLNKGSLIPGIVFTFVCAATTWMAAPRVCLGLTGWMRHLPISGLLNRRLAEIAIFTAQIPILCALIILPLLSVQRPEVSSYSYAFIAGIPFLGYASAKASVPSYRRFWSRTLAYGACILCVSGRWGLLLSGILLLFVTDLISGPLSVSRKKRARSLNFKGYLLDAVIVWRAVKMRVFLPYLSAFILLIFVLLFLSNNQVSPELALKVVIFGGVMSLTVFLALFSNYLVNRRPAWPWVRSLPWSARNRIMMDSVYLFALAVPLLISIFSVNEKAFFPCFLFLPALSLWSSLSIRKGAHLKTGALGSILCCGFIGSLLLAVVPLFWILFLLILPFLVKYAARCEQNIKVSQWLEIHHLAAGDPLSWSQE